MEQIVEEVAKVKDKIFLSRNRLNSTEEQAKRSIRAEVIALRTELERGDTNVKLITARSLGLLLQDGSANAGDMTENIVWLQTELTAVVQVLQTASDKAAKAMGHTETYEYRLMDISQELAVDSNSLDVIYTKTFTLSRQETDALKTCESAISSTRALIRGKERDIDQNNQQAASKRERKTTLETNLRSAEQRIREAEAEKSTRKKRAGGGVGLMIGGVLLIPFTAGASLAMIPAGAGLTTYNACRVDDFKMEKQKHQRDLDALSREISQNSIQTAALQRDKGKLQESLRQHQAELSRRKTETSTRQQRVSDSKSLGVDIKALSDHATSTLSMINQARSELGNIKNQLESCSTDIQRHAIQLDAHTDAVRRANGRRAISAREMERQKAAIQEATDSLLKFQGESKGSLRLLCQHFQIAYAETVDSGKDVAAHRSTYPTSGRGGVIGGDAPATEPFGIFLAMQYLLCIAAIAGLLLVGSYFLLAWGAVWGCWRLTSLSGMGGYYTVLLLLGVTMLLARVVGEGN